MRLKIMTVAVATALAMAGPAVAQDDESETNVSLKGSARFGLSFSDPGGDADATLEARSWASRLNFQGDTAFGNGMTGFGRYEVGVDGGSSGNDNGAFSTRHAYVGVRGDFGEVLIGQTYHTWYNNIIGPVDQPWWGSCNGCLAYTGRSEDGITYSKTAGAFSGGATLYFIGNNSGAEDATSGEDDLDGFELAGTYDAGVVKIGLGIQDFSSPDNDPDPTLGLTVSGSAADVSYAVALTSQGGVDGAEDATGIDVYAGYGNAYIDVGMIDRGNSPFGVTLGYSHPIGPQTLAWFELQATDPDEDGADTGVALRAALKYDWE